MSNIGETVVQMKVDLAKIVNVCNKAEEWRLASLAQGVLQQVGSLSDQFGVETASATAKAELK